MTPERPLRIDFRPVHADLLPPISTGSILHPKFSRAGPIRVHTWCIGCEAAMTQKRSRDNTELCRTRFINAMSSGIALSVRFKDAHEMMSRQPSYAELVMKKVGFDETRDTHQPLPVSRSPPSSPGKGRIIHPSTPIFVITISTTTSKCVTCTI